MDHTPKLIPERAKQKREYKQIKGPLHNKDNNWPIYTENFQQVFIPLFQNCWVQYHLSFLAKGKKKNGVQHISTAYLLEKLLVLVEIEVS